MTTTVILLALLMTLLGAGYVKGYDVVKAKSPEYLPQFYLIMTAIRMLLVLTVIGLYVLFAEHRADTIRFSLICLGMYVVMMVTTLSMRH